MKQRKGFQRVTAMLMASVLIALTLLPSSRVQAAVTEVNIEISSIALIRNNSNPYTDASGNSWLRLHLSNSDYASGGAGTSGITNGDTSWFDAYGTLEKIKLYTNESEEPVALKDILEKGQTADQNVYCPFFAANSIAFNIQDTYDGKTITKVVVEKGAAFPSQTDRSGKAYVTTKDMIVTTKDTSQYQNDSGWNYTRVEDTTVTRFENYTNPEGDPGRLFFKLGTTDLTDSIKSQIFKNKELGTKYNMLDYILFYTKAGEYKKARKVMQNFDEFYWNLWERWDSISFKTTLNPADVKFVLIKKGCEFPSYAEDQNYGKATLSTVYRTTTDIVFNMNDGASSTSETPITGVSGTEVETGLSDLNILDAGNGDYRLRVKLATNDYPVVTATTGSNESLAENWAYRYNMLDMIDLYLNGKETPVSLRKAATGGEARFNLWTKQGTLSLQMTSGYNGTTIRKVVFKKGCQLPSYGMEKETGTNVYVLTEDEVFESTNLANVANETNWNKVDTSVPYDTCVTQIISGHNGGTQLSFQLSANDYTVDTQAFSTGSSKESQYSFLEDIEVYTTSDKMYKLGDTAIYDGGNNSFYRMHGKPNNITVGLKDSASSITKIVIPAGTVFPSYAYSSGQNTKKYGYRTTEAITFVNQNDTSQTNPWGVGTCWSVYEEPANIETTISKIQVRGNENEKGYLFVFLGTHDYSDASANEYVQEHFEEYNILSKIELFTETDHKLLSEVIDKDPLTAEPATYRRFTEAGSISFKLAEGWNGMTIKKISIKQGAQFPSYRYTNGSATSKKAYVLSEDITYATPVSGWSNEQWSKYYEPVVNKTEITNIHVRKGFVLLFLSNHDYEGIQQESFWSKLDAYNLTDMITVTTADGTKKLRHILDSTNQAYYNIWEDTDCVAIKMDTEYNGETIKKVAIKKGAEFPSYTYTSGGTEAKTSYVTEKDYVFNTSTSADENTSWTQVTPYSSETDVSGVTVVDGTLTFTLSKNDYTSGEVGSNHTDFDYWNNVKVYTDDTTPVPLSAWVNNTNATYGNDTLSVTGSGDVERVVIPAKTVFPSYKYTSGKIAECVGYYVPGEKVFEKQSDETWKDVSTGVSKVSGDVNGDKLVTSQDLVAMAKYAEKGYRYNASSLTYDDTKDAAENRHIVRRVILGDVLHNYEKESDNLTYFSSSDMELDSFLNDFYKRQVGYNDYVEGDMTVTSYKPGTTYSSIYNLPWLTKSLLWVDSKNSLESDRTAQLKKQIESIIVDRYGYVWNGDDAVEDPTLGIGKKHGMGWPFPNATHAGNSGSTGDTTNVRFWEFNEDDTLSTWTSSLSDVSKGAGLYQGTTNSTNSVTFTVEDYGVTKSPIIRKTSCAPWLSFELRMSNVKNPENIDDIYVKWVDSNSNEYEVKAGDIAALNYEFGTEYNHVLYLPMYTHTGWNGKQIKKITIEIRGTGAFGGTFALNYVRPSYDTRHSNNNANYIEALKEYYNMTGDVGFVEANITKARKAMNFYLQMYDKDKKLNKQSYLYGHGGDKSSLANGLGNGYWDILYTPVYDFQSNMYFYQALKDLSYLEGVLSTNDVSVSDPATIDTATTSGIESSTYSESASALNTIANDVVETMRTYFWNTETERFMAGYDNSSNKVDYGYTTWNLQAIELGIATEDQKANIMSWIDGSGTVSEGNEKTDIYNYSFAPRTATVDDKGTGTNASGIYGAFIANGGNSTVKGQKFGESLQFGGAVMYSSYYDLTSRIQVNGANNALDRLKGIQSWYNKVSTAYKNSSDPKKSVKDFYLPYFKENGVTMQNGTRGTGNGAVGIDGEFTESLLVAAAIPYGFFGMDSEGGNTLCVTPKLPSTMDHWKVENMQYNGVTYDLSIYKDAVRIDSVRGNAEGLKVKVTLDCPEGKDIYVGETAKKVTPENGKATVIVDFKDAIIEVKVKEK